MKRGRSIALATDFGPPSRGATAQAARLARARGVELTVAHVVEIPVPDPYGASLEGAREMEARAARGLERLVATLRRQGVAARPQVLLGRPGTTLVRYCETAKPWLLVVGTRRLRGWKHLFLGSVAERCLRHAPCPVLVAAPGSRRPFRRILHATDFSPHSEAALDLAVAIAKQDHASLALLHVLDARAVEAIAIAGEPTLAAGRFSRTLFREARDRLAGIARRHRIRHRATVVWGTSPSDAILAQAKSERIDLIVLGSQGRTGLAGFLIGNTAERVGRSLACSLLCTRG